MDNHQSLSFIMVSILFVWLFFLKDWDLVAVSVIQATDSHRLR